MHSMTGYGRSVVSADGRELCMEIRSVNHRYLDLAMRLPRTIGFIEDDIRKMTAEKLSRGHLDIQVTYANHRQDARRVSPDLALARAYKEAIGEIRQALDEPQQSVLREILAMPDVLSVVEGEEDQDAVRGLVRRALEETLGQILIMREAEGRRLASDLMLKVDTLSGIVEAISARAPLVVEEYRTKLHRRLQDLLNGELDESRFQTEVAIFADKAAIDEELVRLRAHIVHIHDIVAGTEPAGRKLDFLAQELNREVNTIGSKASDGEIASMVIAAKAEIEKIREQVQNFE
ncbi:MAG: YicC family protein [Clostridia bacterium]|nr:YicC family protein [Clostridia bacterium]